MVLGNIYNYSVFWDYWSMQIKEIKVRKWGGACLPSELGAEWGICIYYLVRTN